MILEVILAAVLAMESVSAHGRSMALCNVPQGLPMARKKVFSEPLEILRAIVADDIRDGGHFWAAMSFRRINRVCPSVLSVRWV